MTQATHTPGPWTYTRNPENTRFVIDSEPGRALAVTAGFECDNEANARLIAAAPETAAERDRLKEINAELLEALEWALDVIEYNQLKVDDAKARTAIAKARGDQ